jgi:hypothetical protein
MSWLKWHRVELLIFATLLASYAYVLPRWADWSQNSRLDLVLAMVDDGTLSIDKYYQNTGDYALFDGRHYSDKAPGVAFLGAPVYAAARPLLRAGPAQALLGRIARSDAFGATLRKDGSGLLADKISFTIVLYIVTLVVAAVPSALLGVLLFRWLASFDRRAGWRTGVALIYGLATPALPYAGGLFSHQLVACLLFGAFYLAWLIGQRAIRPAWAIAIGLLLGYAVISEYPAALIAAGVGLYTIVALPNRRWVLGLLLGGLPPGLLLVAYNWAIFHSILPLGYEYSALYGDIHGQGFLSLVGPNLPALWGISCGAMRGLFFVAPVLLLAVPGFVAWWRLRQQRREWAVCAWACASFFVFNGSTVMWQGGFAIGPRYLLPMLPFMVLGLGAFAARWHARWWAAALLGGLALWSAMVVWAETLGGQAFPDWSPNPLFEYSLPRLVAGDIARNLGMALGLRGWASLIPLGGLIVALLVVRYWQIRGRRVVWALALGRPRERPGHEAT